MSRKSLRKLAVKLQQQAHDIFADFAFRQRRARRIRLVKPFLSFVSVRSVFAAFKGGAYWFAAKFARQILTFRRFFIDIAQENVCLLKLFIVRGVGVVGRHRVRWWW